MVEGRESTSLDKGSKKIEERDLYTGSKEKILQSERPPWV